MAAELRAPTDKELAEFVYVKTLAQDARDKSINVLGRLAKSPTDEPQNAILLFQKAPFDEGEILDISTRFHAWKPIEFNDIYYRYTGQTYDIERYPAFKATLIWPATDAHIAKYSLQARRLFNETPEIYQSVVKPYIDALSLSKIQWVYNILEKKAEADTIILEVEGEEKGFILTPDMKWDGITMDALYLTVIVHRRDIKSLRDLNVSHLPLLKEIRRKVLELIPQKYPAVGADEVRLFVHYQPTYYHFHVHVVHLRHDTIPGGIVVGRAHLLDDIVGNIETFDPNYYQKATLTYFLGENDALFGRLSEAGARVSP